jgi:hypothetical protein
MHKERQYMKACINFRNDQQDGLRRRPPAELIRDHMSYFDYLNVGRNIVDFDSDNDIFKAFTVDGTNYWLYVEDGYNSRMSVFTEDGQEVDTVVTGGQFYLSGAGGNDGVDLVTSGNTTFISNRQKKAEKLANSGPIYEQHSMISCLVSPRVYSSIKIKWENPDYTQSAITYEVGEDHPEQPIQDIEDVDTGVNTTAGLIANKIREQLVAEGNDNELEIDQEGATIVFRNVTTGVGSELWKNAPSNLGGLVNPWVDEGSGVYSQDGAQTTTIYMRDEFSAAQLGQSMEVTFTITDWVAGSCRALCGGAEDAPGLGTLRSANGTYTETIVVSGTAPTEIGIQADANFQGKVSAISFIPAKGGDVRPFSRVSIEDGSGGAFLAYNGTVKDLNELPRFANPGCLLTVQPNSETNRGKFYMRAESVLDAVAPNPLPTEWATVTSEDRENDANLVQGFSAIFGTTGAVTPTAPLAGFPNQQCYVLGTLRKKPVGADNKTLVQFATIGPAGESVPPNAMQFLEFWDDSTGTPIRQAQVFMYQTSAVTDNGNGDSIFYWEGTIDANLNLIDGRDYKVYIRDVVETFEAVPEVRWIEDSAPGQDTQINPDTFPHVLYRKPDGTFEFGSFSTVGADAVAQLSRRAAGDDDTNPFPAFIGEEIKDLATFQNRLCVLTKDKVSMSVTNRPEEWFRGTVVQVLATSPISIQSTASAASRLEHFVTHNNDLMVFGPNGQFRFDGNRALTPSNAALPQASTYPVELLAKPKSAGNDVFFATSYGESAGLSQFSLDPQIENLSIAKPMADLQIGLMEGSIQQIETVPNTGIVYVRMSSDRNRIYTMEFEQQLDILKPLEPTWAWWQFDWGVDIISMRGNTDYLDVVATGKPGEADAGTLRIYRLDLNAARKVKKFLSYNLGDVHLDVRKQQSGVNTTFSLTNYYPEHKGGVFNPLAPLVVTQGTGCPNPGAVVSYTQNGLDITLDEDMQGGQVFYGYNYLSRIALPDIDVRDGSGIIMSQAKLRILDWQVTMSGHFDAKVALYTGGTYPEQQYRGHQIVGFTDAIGYNRWTYNVQFMQDAENGLLLLESNNHVPMDLHDIEWRGTYYKAGRRF